MDKLGHFHLDGKAYSKEDIFLKENSKLVTLVIDFDRRNNGFVFISFPLHTTHRLQSLDVRLFEFEFLLNAIFNDFEHSNRITTIAIFAVTINRL